MIDLREIALWAEDDTRPLVKVIQRWPVIRLSFQPFAGRFDDSCREESSRRLKVLFSHDYHELSQAVGLAGSIFLSRRLSLKYARQGMKMLRLGRQCSTTDRRGASMYVERASHCFQMMQAVTFREDAQRMFAADEKRRDGARLDRPNARKIDENKLRDEVLKWRTERPGQKGMQAALAVEFGVSEAAISKRIKDLGPDLNPA